MQVSVGQRRENGWTDLFRKPNKVLFTVVCARGLKKGANGKEGQQDFEDCATGIVLVGRLDIASDDIGSRYFIKRTLPV